MLGPRYNPLSKPALEIGDCDACGEMMYDYEVTKCEMCDARIHESCKKICEHCGRPGCMDCMKEDLDGLIICDNCLDSREWLVKTVEQNFKIPGYWGGWRSETNDVVILEYICKDGPKIEVHIHKRETK